MVIFVLFCTTPRLVKFYWLETVLYLQHMQGSTPSLFVGTQAFEVIVKQQIKRLEEPSLKCCTLVYDELIRILGQLLAKIVCQLSNLQSACLSEG